MSSRRDFLRASLLVGGAAMLPRWSFADQGSGDRPFPSPFLRPFALELPLPPVVRPAAPFATRRPVAPGTVFHEIRGREAQQRVHPDLPPTTVWGYADANGNVLEIIWPALAGLPAGPPVLRFQLAHWSPAVQTGVSLDATMQFNAQAPDGSTAAFNVVANGLVVPVQQ